MLIGNIISQDGLHDLKPLKLYKNITPFFKTYPLKLYF